MYKYFDILTVSTGHCSDITSGQPPRGLQFTLGTNISKPLVDTIVMANLVNSCLFIVCLSVSLFISIPQVKVKGMMSPNF